jgi:hypothetical protein
MWEERKDTLKTLTCTSDDHYEAVCREGKVSNVWIESTNFKRKILEFYQETAINVLCSQNSTVLETFSKKFKKNLVCV